jgi:hypothetical protein
MINTIHILNGDALKNQFPQSISGEIIVMRECLIDGNVQGETLADFYQNRADFIESYEQVDVGEYFKRSVPELNKIANISANTSVYCWFEDDLFCQVNFWFVLCSLAQQAGERKIYLVRPNTGNEYSFGHMSQNELIAAYQKPIIIESIDLKRLGNLWRYYQEKQFNSMKALAENYIDKFPFLLPAVNAELDRLPDRSGYGRPERCLLSIMKTLETQDFSAVFQLFHQQEALYSFGDLQVKRMFDNLLKK